MAICPDIPDPDFGLIGWVGGVNTGTTVVDLLMSTLTTDFTVDINGATISVIAGDLMVFALRTCNYLGVPPTLDNGWVESATFTGADSVQSTDTHWQIFTKTAAGNSTDRDGALSLTDASRHPADSTMGLIAIVRKAAAATDFDAAVGVTPSSPVTPQGTRSTANGLFLGWITSDSGALGADQQQMTPSVDALLAFGPSYPGGGDVQYQNGWATGALTGPAAIGPGPVTFTNADGSIGTVSWLTLWVEAVEIADPDPDCTGVVESDAEQCVTVLDYPTSTGGTISGRPNLLCATYGVMIIDRRNRATVLRLPDVGWDLVYGRRVDRTSDAELTVYAGQGPNGRGGVDDACCGALGKAGEWMHELVIWREGNPQEVWGGPITGVRDQLGQRVWSCTAHDRSIWFDERALPYDLVYAGNRKQDAARVFTDLVRAADQPRSYRGMSNSGGQVLPYDPIGLELFAYPTGVMVDQKILLQADDVLIGPEIRSLGDSVIDWCVVGRRMYAGALVLNLDPIPILTTDHWLEQDPEIDRQGIGVAMKVVVRGAGDVRGEYPPGQVTHPRWDQYGSHFKLIKDSTITDNQVATSRARTYWERWQQPNFTVISNSGTLGPKAPVTVEDLIPGRALQIAVLAGCMPTSLRLGESRVGGRTFFAYDSGQVQPLIVPQRLQELSVRVEDSVETEVRIDTQALGTDVRTRGQINYSNAGIGEG